MIKNNLLQNSFLLSGVLIDFISIPVTVGFTSATSVIIGSSQFGSLLGLKISSNGFFDTMTKLVQNIQDTRFSDLGLGVGCIAALLLLRVSNKCCFYIKIMSIFFINRNSKTSNSTKKALNRPKVNNPSTTLFG